MKKLIILSALILTFGCDDASNSSNNSNNNNRDDHCDDGTTPTCDMAEPQCLGPYILAWRDNCYVCVNSDTCEPWQGPNVCESDAECGVDSWCNPCGGASCPGCTDCVGACTAHSCETQPIEELQCNALRPECGENGLAIIRDGCWVCVDSVTCADWRDDHCDDGTEPTCLMEEPECDNGTILAYIDSCYYCVNPDTCLPPGSHECDMDADCETDQYCNPCGTSSCPDCEDCLRACTDNPCATEEPLACYAIRPDCGPGWTAVVVDGCWRCADMENECTMELDEDCNDGTEALCNMIQPECGADEILAVQNNCWVCANPATCMPWGETDGCSSDADCRVEDYCNPCASSSCPTCEDCIAACTPHDCITEYILYCDEERPDCEEGYVPIIYEGCWTCADLEGNDFCVPMN
ncbi:hypothetical protein KKF34_19975 [Myxococcota bacterium]|nr:hypothetical protein [Myxococcota bacterium]MBU1383215.1 hypothetical protein [Myxococcota bacterium]MBU1499167.1 hypothetical protein [Myxococcota bacterium]